MPQHAVAIRPEYSTALSCSKLFYLAQDKAGRLYSFEAPSHLLSHPSQK